MSGGDKMGVRLNFSEVCKIRELREKGYTLDQIAEITGKSKGVVCKYTKDLIKQSPCRSCPDNKNRCTKTDGCPDWFGWFCTEWNDTCEKLRKNDVG